MSDSDIEKLVLQRTVDTVNMRLDDMYSTLVEILGPKAGCLGTKTKMDNKSPVIFALTVNNLVHRLCNEYRLEKSKS